MEPEYTSSLEELDNKSNKIESIRVLCKKQRDEIEYQGTKLRKFMDSVSDYSGIDNIVKSEFGEKMKNDQDINDNDEYKINNATMKYPKPGDKIKVSYGKYICNSKTIEIRESTLHDAECFFNLTKKTLG